MKGGISLRDFIKEVKEDLRSAINREDRFFVMEEVELEVSFALDVGGGGKTKLFVVEVGAETKASQTHKVRIKLIPHDFEGAARAASGITASAPADAPDTQPATETDATGQHYVPPEPAINVSDVQLRTGLWLERDTRVWAHIAPTQDFHGSVEVTLISGESVEKPSEEPPEEKA